MSLPTPSSQKEPGPVLLRPHASKQFIPLEARFLTLLHGHLVLGNVMTLFQDLVVSLADFQAFANLFPVYLCFCFHQKIKAVGSEWLPASFLIFTMTRPFVNSVLALSRGVSIAIPANTSLQISLNPLGELDPKIVSSFRYLLLLVLPWGYLCVLIEFSFSLLRWNFVVSVSPCSFCLDVTMPSLSGTQWAIALWPHTPLLHQKFPGSSHQCLQGIIANGQL